MSSIAKQIQQQEEEQQQVQTVVYRRKARISFGEMVLLCVFAVVIAVVSVKIISNQSALYQTNKEIQQSEAEITEQSKLNTDLKNQVKELSTYERIWQKAEEMGLSLTKDVKGVQK